MGFLLGFRVLVVSRVRSQFTVNETWHFRQRRYRLVFPEEANRRGPVRLSWVVLMDYGHFFHFSLRRVLWDAPVFPGNPFAVRRVKYRVCERCVVVPDYGGEVFLARFYFGPAGSSDYEGECFCVFRRRLAVGLASNDFHFVDPCLRRFSLEIYRQSFRLVISPSVLLVGRVGVGNRLSPYNYGLLPNLCHCVRELVVADCSDQV